MLKRTRKTLWIVAAIVLVLAAALYLRFKAPPEAARRDIIKGTETRPMGLLDSILCKETSAPATSPASPIAAQPPE